MDQAAALAPATRADRVGVVAGRPGDRGHAHGAAFEWCHATCLELPAATLDQPFGPDTDAFRIHGKMFALLMFSPRVSEHLIVNLKAEPFEVPLLIATHDIVQPGYHMSKKHWITVVLRPGADLELVAELVEDSYDGVVAGLPARLRSPLAAFRPQRPRSVVP